jgi:hypothetical protein
MMVGIPVYVVNVLLKKIDMIIKKMIMSYLDPTLWEEFWHKVWRATICPVKWFICYFIPKWWEYTKLLYTQDIDFEFEHLLPLIELKTKRVREYLLWENVTHVDVKHMREVELLCRRIFEDDYLEKDKTELDSRYPVKDIVDDFILGGNRCRQHKLTKPYYKEFRILSKRCERIKKQDEERLWKLLSKYLHCWWS